MGATINIQFEVCQNSNQSREPMSSKLDTSDVRIRQFLLLLANHTGYERKGQKNANKNNQTSCLLQVLCSSTVSHLRWENPPISLQKPAGQLLCGLTGVAKPCGLSRDSFHVEHQNTGLCEEFWTSSSRYPKPLTNQRAIMNYSIKELIH